MKYEFTYDGTSSPKWEKVFEATSGETFRATLTFKNVEDREALSLEEVKTYLNLLLSYAKDLVSKFEIYPLEQPPTDGFQPIQGNYESFLVTIEEINEWWQWAYFSDSFDLHQMEEEPE